MPPHSHDHSKSEDSYAILIENVVKKFNIKNDPTTALSNVTAYIKRGAITGLVGPDGAGKTTLLRLLAGLLDLTEGEIVIEGLKPSSDTYKLHTILGYMPQKFGLYEDLSVMENLILYADLHGVLGDARSKIFKQLLHFTDLERFPDRKAGNLSGGMKQKLGLACTLLGNPSILLLDEPTVGVDPVSRAELWKMVNTLVLSGTTVVWSTAYLNEAELCSEVILLNEGKLIYAGTPLALTEKVKHRTIQIQNIESNHRRVLQLALRSPQVIDGTIQGQYVRLLLRKEDELPDIKQLQAGPEARVVPVKPRFEDAFMDILGGGPGGDSILTKIMKPVKIDNEIVIEANNLTKQFGTFIATNHINFKVKQGEVFGLLGPNGAGKSTTFKMMCGLLMPTTGSARVLGIDLHSSGSLARQKIGYMAQKFSLYGDLSVQQNLQFFSGIYGLRGRIQKEKMEEMIEAFELHSLLNARTNDISLGFKQRLALACAIMHEPVVLFLDEPTSGVDPITRREFWSHINGLVGKGVTIMVTTHFMEESEYCDRIAFIYRGKLIASGTPDELKELIRDKNHPEPTMEDTFVELVKRHDANQPIQTDAVTTQVDEKSVNHVSHISWIARHDSLRRLVALSIKEFYQIIRDPSNILIAFIIPLLMLIIFGFGINFDSAKIRLGLVLEDTGPDVNRFVESFTNSPFFRVIPIKTRNEAKKQITAGNIRGFVSIQPNFTKQLTQSQGASVELVTDGSESNTAQFVTQYVKGAKQVWQQLYQLEKGKSLSHNISIEPRYWFNPAAISRYFIVPGSIAIIMTVIGAMLTSLVVAKEWERGTMEGLLSTPVTRYELLFSKLIPYYVLGIVSMIICTLTAIYILGTPFYGSFLILFIVTSLFLGSALSIGLLLSSATRNQFNAAVASLNATFLPAMLLSGFVFEISSMPIILQAITYLIPVRYFVTSLQTLFLAGNIGIIIIKDMIFLLISALFFLALTYKSTTQKLD